MSDRNRNKQFLDGMGEVNPFELLGVTVSSSPKEVKRSFNELSLLMHPDKGGNQNDMMILQYAYEYVSQQIKWAEKASSDMQLKSDEALKQLEQTFKDFCIEQEKQPSELYVINTNDRFNEMWKQNVKTTELWGAANQEGYETDMIIDESKQDIHDMSKICQYDASAGLYPSPLQFKTDLIIYNEPNPTMMHTYIQVSTSSPYDLTKRMDDFGEGVSGLYDYKKAYTEYEMKDSREIIDPIPSLESIEKQRKTRVLW